MNTKILPASPESIRAAAEALRRGELVAIPTETVYGLAAHALDEKAVASVFSAKERPTFDPLIVHVAFENLQAPLRELSRLGLVDETALSPTARETADFLLQTFWPGPFTLVLPKNPRVPDLVTSGLPSVAVRMPRHPIAEALLRESGLPLAAPSANRFGRISPTSAQDVLKELRGRIPWILDGGPCEIGVESTVLQILPDGTLHLLRPGAIFKAEIEHYAEAPVHSGPAVTQPGTPAASPGTLASHYAPSKPLFLGDPESLAGKVPSSTRHIGFLAAQGDEAEILHRLEKIFPTQKITLRILSPEGDDDEAARNLFSHLRTLDESSAEILLSEKYPDREGLAHAIRDRLKRAKR